MCWRCATSLTIDLVAGAIFGEDSSTVSSIELRLRSGRSPDAGDPRCDGATTDLVRGPDWHRVSDACGHRLFRPGRVTPDCATAVRDWRRTIEPSANRCEATGVRSPARRVHWPGTGASLGGPAVAVSRTEGLTHARSKRNNQRWPASRTRFARTRDPQHRDGARRRDPQTRDAALHVGRHLLAGRRRTGARPVPREAVAPHAHPDRPRDLRCRGRRNVRRSSSTT